MEKQVYYIVYKLVTMQTGYKVLQEVTFTEHVNSFDNEDNAILAVYNEDMINEEFVVLKKTKLVPV